jgi:hypothetical protein
MLVRNFIGDVGGNMAAFFDYMRNITYYLVFMAFVAVLAPNGNYRKYISLVCGIVLIGLVVRPAAVWLSSGVPLNTLFAQALPLSDAPDLAGVYGAQSYALVRQSFHAQLTEQAENLLARNGFHGTVEVETSEDFSQVTRVVVTLYERADAVPRATARPFIYIEPVTPVRIGGGTTEAPSETVDPTVQAVRRLIGDFYQMPYENVLVKRGNP